MINYEERLLALEQVFNLKEEDLDEAKKKKKDKYPFSSATYTTGDINLNIARFNRAMGTDYTNPSTEEAKKAAEDTAEDAGANDSSSDGDGTGNNGAADGGTGMGESLITEAKREVRRYYLKPQELFCANKAEVIHALISIGEEDCTVYTLINLGDIKDVTKLTTNDVIYYYEDGILYDKNHVKVMDYDLYIKHEEKRPKFASIDNISAAKFVDEYEDRITEITGPALEEDLNFDSKEDIITDENELNLDFDAINAYGEKITESKNDTHTCAICGEDFVGYGNNPAPVRDFGTCCDACNTKFVIPARLDQMATKQDNE